MKAKSRDLSSEMAIGEDLEKKFKELLADFLKDLVVRIEKLPVTLHVEVKTEGNMWWFEADVQDD